MFFEVLRPIYHSPITIESLTYRLSLGKACVRDFGGNPSPIHSSALTACMASRRASPKVLSPAMRLTSKQAACVCSHLQCRPTAQNTIFTNWASSSSTEIIVSNNGAIGNSVISTS